MTDLLLDEKEQAAVRAILASESPPGAVLLGEGALRHVARLIDCDAIGVVMQDDTGCAIDAVAREGDATADDGAAAYDGPISLGIQQFNRDAALTHRRDPLFQDIVSGNMEEGARRFPESYRFASCRLRLMGTPAVPAASPPILLR